MTAFDLDRSFEEARSRLGPPGPARVRAPRSDRGRRRLPPAVVACVDEATSGTERPPMRRLLAVVRERCAALGVRPPSRATVYKLIATLPGPGLPWERLPAPVRSALYNLSPGSVVPAAQVAFYCFNYGELPAMSFAAGLPWRALYQALRMPGFRERSRGPLEAVARVRRI